VKRRVFISDYIIIYCIYVPFVNTRSFGDLESDEGKPSSMKS